MEPSPDRSPPDEVAIVRGLKGERVLMRIHIGEDDQWEGQPLYVAIVELLRRRHAAGATVFRGILGYGAHARLHHPSLFRLSSDAPIVIECIDTQATIEALLAELDGMIGGGLITLERARVILYRPTRPPGEPSADGWSLDITGDWQLPLPSDHGR